MTRYNANITDDEKQWRESLGKRIKVARKERGILQKELAKMLGVSVVTVCELERGKTGVKVYTFYKACQILGKCANSMMGRKCAK